MFKGADYCERDGAGRCLSCCAAFYGVAKGAITATGNRLMRGAEVANVDLFVAVSHAVAEANQLDRAGARFEVVPNFVADAGIPPAADAPELEALPTKPFIVQVGDVVADKGVHVLFEAYRRLDSPPPLVLIGRIAPEIRDALPPGALAMGVWPHELVAHAWRRSLFGTMPSLCLDACPTVTMEAMAARRPVVASARGGLIDQVADGVTGLLVPPGDPAALAEAMTRLIDSDMLRQQMGQAARQRYEERFRSDVVIDRIEQLYLSLLG